MLVQFFLPGIDERLSWNGKSPLKRSALNPFSPLFSSPPTAALSSHFFFSLLSSTTNHRHPKHTLYTYTHTHSIPKKIFICSTSSLPNYLYKYPSHPSLLEPHTSALLSKGPVPFQPNQQPFNLTLHLLPYSHTHPSPLLNDNYLHISQ